MSYCYLFMHTNLTLSSCYIMPTVVFIIHHHPHTTINVQCQISLQIILLTFEKVKVNLLII